MVVATTDDTQNQDIYIPPLGTIFEWRLDDLPANYTTTAEVVDIDAISASTTLVTNLQRQGKKVLAYLSVEGVENFRPDAGDFPKATFGDV